MKKISDIHFNIFSYKSFAYRSLWLYVLLFSLFPELAWATHNRAGEITYVSAPTDGEPYRFDFTITTYTSNEDGSLPADRDELEVDFGDGTPIQFAPRVNGPLVGDAYKGEDIAPGIRYNVYEITHSYAAPFNYVVSMQDPNRIASIENFLAPSVDIPFCLQDTIFILDPQFFGYNSSPVLFQPPIDYANVGYPFIHNPNAFDVDGDSLYFELIAPLEAPGQPIIFYDDPDQIEPGADNNISLNPYTGEFIWDSPQRAGIYNIAFLIREFRNGIQIGNMIRDMQIIVEDVNNEPPDVPPINDICAIIGDEISISVSASDNDIGQTVTLSAFGGPFELESSPAVFESSSGIGAANGLFTWQTVCDHIYSQEYTIVFKAEDNFSTGAGPLPLVDLETWLIQLVPPPPEDLQTTVAGNDITLTWNNTIDYLCLDNEKFLGFSVWRKVGCDTLDLDACDTGLTGYVKLADGLTVNTFTDETAQKGIQYTYRVTAEFADAFTESTPAAPINVGSSAPSNGVCVELPKNSPILTHVDILTTEETGGDIRVIWSKPKPEALDTMVNMPPYSYVLYRSTGVGGTDFVLVDSLVANSFATANDTIYDDQAALLNTLNTGYTYKLRFYVNTNELLDETVAGSSVFLNLTPGDNTLTLNWDFTVPWLNYEYHIFRQNDAGTFDSIGLSTSPSYIDDNLKNGKTYCYYVRALGTYASTGLVDPLINHSQIACAAPIDNEPPCAPVLSVLNDCDEGIAPVDADSFINFADWTNPNDICANDVIGYVLYYSAPTTEEFTPIAELNDPSLSDFDHELQNTLAGCYYVTAIDSFQNVSAQSNLVCKENCLAYELPNTFTPNGDTQNDLFVPRTSLFVSSVNFKVYNRWGGLVFETTDPLLNWDGKDNSGRDLDEGVYYYGCDVYEQSSDGIESVYESLSGYIHLLR